MSINLETGLWNCFGECGTGGDIYTFYQKYHNVGFKKAKQAINGDVNTEPSLELRLVEEEKKEDEVKVIESEVIDKLEEQLWGNAVALKFLKEERGLTDKTIKKLRMGYRQGRFAFPVFDTDGVCRNIRLYSRKETKGKKVISWKTGYGEARILGIENLEANEIYLFEGEMDWGLAVQLGYIAITITGGAGTWKEEWNELFRNKNVVICYDIDKPGRRGSEKIARELYGKASQIKIIHLPLTEPTNADFSNYIVDNGHSKKDFDSLVSKTKPYSLAEAIEKDEKIYDVHLSQASHSKYFNQKVKIKAVVAGKDLAPYIVPSEVKFTCNAGKKACEFCKLGIANGEEEVKILRTDPNLLLFLDTSKDIVKNYLKRMAGIPAACYAFEMETLKTINIESLLLIPELDWSAEDQDYVTRRSFFVGHGLKSGRSYEFIALTVPEPKSQYATHLIFEGKTATDDVSAFQIDDNLKKELKIFQPKENQSVEDKMNEVADDLSANVTQIYGRNDLHIAIDLVYHSALSFNFLGKFLRKGWLELLILGDTRTGKTETAQRLIEHYKLGEFVTGESSSYAGLVGGMQQNQNRWSITWGKIPLNDRRIVFIDEVSGLSADAIGNMSGVRSSGIAEITKIQTERTNARTRLVWVSNPRENMDLHSRTYPVVFLRNLIGRPEDIARFDFVVTCASGEVSSEVINSIKHKKIKHQYTSDLCKNLILWIWSRHSNQIHFEKDAIDCILQRAIEFGETYSPTIPLVEAADVRMKIAKLSAATAARLFSTEDEETLIVKKEHVEFVCKFLEKLFKKPTLKYYQYSQQQVKGKKRIKENSDKIKSFLIERPELLDFLEQYDYFSERELEMSLGIDKEERKNISKFLFKHRLVRRTTRGVKKSPEFIDLINTIIEENEKKKAEGGNKKDVYSEDDLPF